MFRLNHMLIFRPEGAIFSGFFDAYHMVEEESKSMTNEERGTIKGMMTEFEKIKKACEKTVEEHAIPDPKFSDMLKGALVT